MSLRTASIKHGSSDDEKGQPAVDRGVGEAYYTDAEDPLEENDVFKKTHEGVDFRTVGWPRASVIFLKGRRQHQDSNIGLQSRSHFRNWSP